MKIVENPSEHALDQIRKVLDDDPESGIVDSRAALQQLCAFVTSQRFACHLLCTVA
ncbi:hypothetical protein ACOCG7_09610 [Paraburkholderia sp. DD10]|uniref:hypothetical protein n=1 Tax=Paraburkholderia TaxID=1822464 RepID=UPI0013749D2C|nr:hypothetical protein [Paraburkholderia terricola]